MADAGVDRPEPGLLTRWFGLADMKTFAGVIRDAIDRDGPDGVDDADARALIDRYRVRPGGAGRALAAVARERAASLGAADFADGARDGWARLAARLSAAGDTVAGVLHDRAREIYGLAVDQAVADEALGDEEAAALERLRGVLGLDAEEGAMVFGERVNILFNSRMREALEDGMLSPDEDARLQAMCASLTVASMFEGETARILEDARTAWAISHGPLPQVAAPVSLQRGEVAHAIVEASAHEERTRTTSIRYGGPAVRVKIMKGVYYKAGGYSVGRSTEAYEHDLGEGELIVTSKRLIFIGGNRAYSPRLDSILRIEPYVDAVRVTRGAGKPMLFRFARKDPWFGAILQRARDEA